MAESVTSGEMTAQRAKVSDLTMVLVVAGFACLLAGILSSVFSGALLGISVNGELNGPLATDYELGTVSLCMWLGLFLVQFTSYTPYVEQSVPQRFAMRSLSFIIAFSVAIAVIALPVVFAISLPVGLLALAWFCLGGLSGLLLPIWGNAWTAMDAERSENRTTALMVGWSVVTAVVLCTFTFFAPPLVSIIATWAFFLASNGLLVYCTRQLPVHQPINVKASKNHLSIFSRNLIVPGVLTLILGATLCYCLLTLSPFTSFLCLLVSALAAALIMIVLLLVLRRVPQQSTLERWVISACGSAFALIIFAAPQFELFALMLVLTSLILITCYHFNVLIALSYRHQVLTLYHYAQGLIASLGGLALGWLAMALMIMSGVVDANTLWKVMVVFLLLLLLTSCIVPFKSNVQVESVFLQGEPVELSKMESEESRAGAQGAEFTGFWKQRMQSIAENNHLSPREMEVFALLAKGRNAEHISKALFISTHTVKTHISRIYRKLEVNTQQELIDMVDNQQTC